MADLRFCPSVGEAVGLHLNNAENHKMRAIWLPFFHNEQSVSSLVPCLATLSVPPFTSFPEVTSPHNVGLGRQSAVLLPCLGQLCA